VGRGGVASIGKARPFRRADYATILLLMVQAMAIRRLWIEYYDNIRPYEGCPSFSSLRREVIGGGCVLEPVLKDYFRARRRSIRRIMAMRMKATEVRKCCS
jgi:hypothetical protein